MHTHNSCSWFLASLTPWSRSSFELKAYESVLSSREAAKYLAFLAFVEIDFLCPTSRLLRT